jgi:trehalose 6-phosphate phosphatase
MSAPPKPSPDWALFLDIDGTLIDIAARPSAVVVPKRLPPLLWATRARLGGALALVSGRLLDDIDRMMAPYHFPCAAEHGAILRFGDGSARAHPEGHVVPEPLREELHAAAMSRWPGATIEEKTFNIVVHYRQAPSYRDDIHAFLRALVDKAGDRFELLPARMAFEVRHRAINKGAAVRAFMTQPAFAARVPVFVGDDITDEDGFRAAEALGGLRVDVRRTFAGEPADVRAWLDTFALQLQA